jgi:hypothetical protein
VVATPVAGTYSAAVKYLGDGNYSSVDAVNVIPNLLQITINSGSPLPITISDSGSPAKLGDTITWTAVVTGASGGTAPTGPVNFTVTSTPFSGTAHTVTCVNPTGPLTTVGTNQSTYTCSVNATSAGSYAAVATFQGDTNYSALPSSGSDTVVVSPAAVTGNIVLTGSGGTGVLGTTLVFTAIVTGQGGVAPT